MSLILSGTDGLSDVDGSASTPAIRGTDTNTGIFFPAADTIAFAEGGAEVARFDSSGRLGVGTTSPSNRLVVQDADTQGTAVNIVNTSSGGYNWNIFSCGSLSTIDSTGSLAFRDSTNGATRMSITPNGRMFFYSLSSGAGTNALKWSTSTGQMTYDTSSARYKDNIRDSIYGLNHVMQMRSAQFEYKDDGRSDVGLIAEELQPIVSELVGLDKDGQADSVSYDRMVSVLVKAIQEQQAIITDLKSRIEALEA